MKKGTFKRYSAQSTIESTGWIYGNFGICKLNNRYEITHIPTGGFVRRFDRLKWAKQFIERITENDDWSVGEFGKPFAPEQRYYFIEIIGTALSNMDY